MHHSWGSAHGFKRTALPHLCVCIASAVSDAIVSRARAKGIVLGGRSSMLVFRSLDAASSSLLHQTVETTGNTTHGQARFAGQLLSSSGSGSDVGDPASEPQAGADTHGTGSGTGTSSGSGGGTQSDSADDASVVSLPHAATLLKGLFPVRRANNHGRDDNNGDGNDDDDGSGGGTQSHPYALPLTPSEVAAVNKAADPSVYYVARLRSRLSQHQVRFLGRELAAARIPMYRRLFSTVVFMAGATDPSLLAMPVYLGFLLLVTLWVREGLEHDKAHDVVASRHSFFTSAIRRSWVGFQLYSALYLTAELVYQLPTVPTMTTHIGLVRPINMFVSTTVHFVCLIMVYVAPGASFSLNFI